MAQNNDEKRNGFKDLGKEGQRDGASQENNKQGAGNNAGNSANRDDAAKGGEASRNANDQGGDNRKS